VRATSCPRGGRGAFEHCSDYPESKYRSFEDKGVAGVKLFKTGAKIVLGLGERFSQEKKRKLSERFDRSREAK
jgi:hypothetical protein